MNNINVHTTYNQYHATKTNTTAKHCAVYLIVMNSDKTTHLCQQHTRQPKQLTATESTHLNVKESLGKITKLTQ